MKGIVIKVALGLAGVLALGAAGGGVFLWSQVSAFEASLAKVYDVPLRQVVRGEGEAALARGKHLVDAMGACGAADCHGADLAGGKTIDAGPLGKVTAPNITGAGLGGVYTDAELVRVIEHGITKGGTTVRFMPSFELNWFSDDDTAAILAYIRSVPPVQKANGPFEIGLVGKVLDRQGMFTFDIARKIDHSRIEKAPAPAPTAEYGRFVAKGCLTCHGETYGGGPIPGAPPEFPVPVNITPHETGLPGYEYEEFTKLLDTGIRRNGKKLDPFMPLASLAAMNEIERRALFEFLLTIPPKPFGSR